MFMDLERNYLLKLARSCFRKGLSEDETYTEIQRDTGGFTAPARIRCAIETVFQRKAAR